MSTLRTIRSASPASWITPLRLTYEEVLAYPAYERVITLYCVEGWDATILWEGVRLVDLFVAAQTQGGANTAIFKCVDGYTTSLPIETIVDRDLLLAYNANTAPLAGRAGLPVHRGCRGQTGL